MLTLLPIHAHKFMGFSLPHDSMGFFLPYGNSLTGAPRIPTTYSVSDNMVTFTPSLIPMITVLSPICIVYIV